MHSDRLKRREFITLLGAAAAWRSQAQEHAIRALALVYDGPPLGFAAEAKLFIVERSRSFTSDAIPWC